MFSNAFWTALEKSSGKLLESHAGSAQASPPEATSAVTSIQRAAQQQPQEQQQQQRQQQ
jgi:hypothetical protein